MLLYLNAYPFEKFGALNAKVTEISNTPLPMSNNRSQISDSMYQVVAELPSQFINAYGVLKPLQDGMTIEADLHIERRSIIEWFIEPLLAVLGQ